MIRTEESLITTSTIPHPLSNWSDGLPDSIYDIIFSLISGKDLLLCRSVCKFWDAYCTPILFTKTLITFDGRKNVRISKWLSNLFGIVPPDKRLVSLIKDNPHWLNNWSDLKLHRNRNSDINTILTSLCPSVRKLAFESVTSLQLSNCTLSWTPLIKLLEMLENLRNFNDSGTFVLFDSAASLCYKSYSQIQENILADYAHFRKELTKVTISRSDVGIKTLIYFKLLELFVLNLEDLELNISTNRYSLYHEVNRSFDYSSVIGLLLLKHAGTLKTLSVEWVGHMMFHFVEDFYRSLSILCWSQSTLLLTRVSLNFDFIFIGNPNFQEVLVPFIVRLENLKSLSIKKLIFQAEFLGLLLQAQPQNFEEIGTEIRLGILLSDHPDLGTSSLNMTAIRDNSVLRNRLGMLRVAISSTRIRYLSQVLPLCSDIEYKNAEELTISRVHCPFVPCQFLDYEISDLCDSFQNLCQLTILDGKRFTYRGRYRIRKQYEQMSVAGIKDAEMQLVLRSLTKLKRLRLRLRMDKLTDLGTTGLSLGTVDRMIEANRFQIEERDFVGLSFSNLKDLEEVLLKGLHEGISDVTAFHAFNHLPKLKILGLFGETKISSLGKAFLVNKLPESGGCYGYKECLEDGTWFKHPGSNQTWSNYTTCVDVEEYQWRRLIVTLNEAGYILSVFALISSLLIFCSFKCLECTRVRIHKHLFVSFIISNLLWLAWYRIVTFNEYVLLIEPWWCKGLHVLVQYFLMANYFWMFCEGFYLHTLLVFAFIRSDSELLHGFYIFGWLGPLIPISVYTALRIRDSHEDQVPCWTGDSKWGLLLAVPVCLSLVLNLGFLVNIVRVLVTKLKNTQRSFTNVTRRNSSIIAPDSHYSLRKAVRATLILIPLLGLHYLLVPIRPLKGTNWEAAYDIVSAAAASLQGFCVSILFCFCNSEVMIVIRRRLLSRLCQYKSSSPDHRDDNNSGPLPTTRGDQTTRGITGSLTLTATTERDDHKKRFVDESSPISLEMMVVIQRKD